MRSAAMSAIWSRSGKNGRRADVALCRFGGHARRPLQEVTGHGREAWRSASEALRGCRAQHFVPAHNPRSLMCYCVKNLYVTIRATMLAKISSGGGIFGSLASSNGARPIDRAEVEAVSGTARLCPLSLVCELLAPAPRPHLPFRCNKRCRPRERLGPWTRPRSSSRVALDN
jgi:hypothetical protein